MRMSPAQIAMHKLLGHRLLFVEPNKLPLMDRIKDGRDSLVKITQQDFGYDAMAWHDYLWDSDAGGYRWEQRCEDKWAREVESAMLDPDWQQAVKELNEIYIRQAITAGIEDSEAGRTIDVKDVRAEFGLPD